MPSQSSSSVLPQTSGTGLGHSALSTAASTRTSSSSSSSAPPPDGALHAARINIDADRTLARRLRFTGTSTGLEKRRSYHHHPTLRSHFYTPRPVVDAARNAPPPSRHPRPPGSGLRTPRTPAPRTGFRDQNAPGFRTPARWRPPPSRSTHRVQGSQRTGFRTPARYRPPPSRSALRARNARGSGHPPGRDHHPRALRTGVQGSRPERHGVPDTRPVETTTLAPYAPGAGIKTRTPRGSGYPPGRDHHPRAPRTGCRDQPGQFAQSGTRFGSNLTCQLKMKPLSIAQRSSTRSFHSPLSGQPTKALHGCEAW
jgi:hypothetical protein